MKKTAILLSAVIAGAMALPTAANAKSEYPSNPGSINNAKEKLSEEEYEAYCLGWDNYHKALADGFVNGEYNWDFNLDGVTEIFDMVFLLEYYAELATDTKIDSFTYITDYDKKEYITCEFTDEMKALIAEAGDVNGDGMIRADDAGCMLLAMYSAEKQGDVNTDGMVDARDASDVLTVYANNSVSIQSDYVTEKNMEYLGDLNGDGKNDASDASAVLRVYSENSVK